MFERENFYRDCVGCFCVGDVFLGCKEDRISLVILVDGELF